MKIITLQRQWYTPDATIGQLIIDGKPFCFTLEDTCRAYGIKVKGATAIPVTTDFFYNIAITKSERFGKELPIIYTQITKDGYVLKCGGIEFTAIRMHGGNTSADTDGCVLVAFNFDGKEKIYGNADDEVTDAIRKMGNVGLKVVNLPNKF